MSELRKDNRTNQDLQEICIYKFKKITLRLIYKYFFNRFIKLLYIVIRKNIKSNKTSSIYIESSHLKILCSIEGPIFFTGLQTRNQDLSNLNLEVNINFPSYLERNFKVKKYISNKSTTENCIENLLRNVILSEKYARNKIVISIDVIEINCDLIPYAVIGLSLALNEANIEQRGLCSASNIIRKNGDFIVDPTFEEEEGSEFKLLWGCLYDLEENTFYKQKGNIDEENLKQVYFNEYKYYK